MKLKFTPIAAAVLCTISTMATAGTYTCQLNDTRNTGWLPERLIFQIIEGKTTAKAFDPITFSTLNGLAAGQVQAENSVRVELRWTTGRYRNERAMKSRDMPSITATNIVYRATILRGGNKILLRAQPEGSLFGSVRKGCAKFQNRRSKMRSGDTKKGWRKTTFPC
jgi:hypothetical protein